MTKTGHMNRSKQDIDYIEGGIEMLDLVALLWAELNDYHQSISKHFAEQFAARTFAEQKAMLVEKVGQGRLRVDVAMTSAGEYIGYCISTINDKQVGEVDSIFVQEPFRNQGIGDVLMQRAMVWMDAAGTNLRIIEVAWDNQRVWSLYEKHGFLPRCVRLTRTPRGSFRTVLT